MFAHIRQRSQLTLLALVPLWVAVRSVAVCLADPSRLTVAAVTVVLAAWQPTASAITAVSWHPSMHYVVAVLTGPARGLAPR